MKCFSDDKFFQEELGREKSLGEVDHQTQHLGVITRLYVVICATGGRMIITLLQALEETNGKYGLATACAAGGLGAAMIVGAIEIVG